MSSDSARVPCNKQASSPAEGSTCRLDRRDFLFNSAACAVFAGISLAHPARTLAADESGDAGNAGALFFFATLSEGRESRLVEALFRLDAATFARTKIADGTPLEQEFRVSPDGRSLAFTRYQPMGDGHVASTGIWLRDLTSAKPPRSLTNFGTLPRWSPDGKQLLLVDATEVPGTQRLRSSSWLVDADGSHPRTLAIPSTDQPADWSPAGDWIVTTSSRDQDAGYQIYRMRLDGSEARRLTTTGRGVLNLDPRISPDGGSIAYRRLGDTEAGLWIVAADGSNSRLVFKERVGVRPFAHCWSPDGKRIALAVRGQEDRTEGQAGDDRLLLVPLDGGQPVAVPLPGVVWFGEPQWLRDR